MPKPPKLTNKTTGNKEYCIHIVINTPKESVTCAVIRKGNDAYEVVEALLKEEEMINNVVTLTHVHQI